MRISKILIGALIVFVLSIYFIFSAPLKNREMIVHIREGRTVSSISQELKDNNQIRSQFVFKTFIKILKSGKGIVSGDYLIKKNSPVWKIAWQVGRGHHNISPIKITLREGITNKGISDVFVYRLPNFDKEKFLELTAMNQGYLFPDTYFIYPLDTVEEIIKKLEVNFEKRIDSVSTEINQSGKNLSDVIIMASILEGEASGKEDIGIISGILWKRISLGMPLQVDIDKATYKEKGLPENPLNNPGLISIKAAAEPISSSYLYYLHDKNGKVHFAKSYDEHRVNIRNYLK
jgi:UPF0755 protein